MVRPVLQWSALNNNANWSDSPNCQYSGKAFSIASVRFMWFVDLTIALKHNKTWQWWSQSQTKCTIRFSFSLVFFFLHPQNVYCITHIHCWHKGFKVSREWKEILKWSQWLFDKMHKQFQFEWQMNNIRFPCLLENVYSFAWVGRLSWEQSESKHSTFTKSVTQKTTCKPKTEE